MKTLINVGHRNFTYKKGEEIKILHPNEIVELDKEEANQLIGFADIKEVKNEIKKEEVKADVELIEELSNSKPKKKGK